jgi:hypothetical protein
MASQLLGHEQLDFRSCCFRKEAEKAQCLKLLIKAVSMKIVETHGRES